MVISFSVINYVVSMRHPRVSDEVSFFLYMLYIKNETYLRLDLTTYLPPVLTGSDSPEGHTDRSPCSGRASFRLNVFDISHENAAALMRLVNMTVST